MIKTKTLRILPVLLLLLFCMGSSSIPETIKVQPPASTSELLLVETPNLKYKVFANSTELLEHIRKEGLPPYYMILELATGLDSLGISPIRIPEPNN